MTKKTETDEQAAPPEPVMPAAIPSVDGWYSDADWIRVECDGETPWERLRPRDGAQPLWIELDATLTIREVMSIPLAKGKPLAGVIPHLVNRVRAWNVHEFDPETGQFVPVPPPSEIGADAFARCRPAVIEWIATMLQTMSLGGGPKGESATQQSGDGVSSPNVAD